MRADTAEDWTKLALCAGHPGRGWWFPADYHDETSAKAIAICRACPVAEPCLDYAITTGQSEGIWGGATPRRRSRISRTRLRGQ